MVFDDPETGLNRISNNRQVEELTKYEIQTGVPIYRSNLMYNVPYKKNYKTHNHQVQIQQQELDE